MPKVQILNQQGENVGELELNEAIFGVDVNEHVVYEVVRNQLANKRQGTQSAKTRSEVRGGGKKPWRQKGTGRARQGSIRSPQWRGGGVVFAPKPRDYSYAVPKKVRRLAIKSVLTDKVNDNEMIVLDKLSLDAISTKKAVEVLKNIKADKKALVVVDKNDDTLYRSFRNIENVAICEARLINVYDCLKYNSLVITTDAVKILEEVFQ
ncbi:50S ribosomal protein L4 [Finegoldia sp. BIOML-A2]|uniref:Large ribosomal subunit protein uL4 n=3 Tax=Finegoldia TaxID=150022 RepID=A0A233W6H2_FINMA|nr:MULTISPECIES: 50S ribosomal protein L4 [Finegoldia]EFH93601.1 50S ribosomal protein L4 [Finegoldia magna ATCC 53516]MBS5360269.1 50S ribosomal protein L4 [Finegoldia magna]MBS5776075.1 50S ribosomal protein L4 [Finegoldia magna]MBS5943008.1 50S ribosomal protein L4 [Finegoldia magna]MBS5964611.1 50S ribosomal protein L4 [Finegoldia magna]